MVMVMFISEKEEEEVGRDKTETRRRNYLLTSHKPRAQSPYPVPSSQTTAHFRMNERKEGVWGEEGNWLCACDPAVERGGYWWGEVHGYFGSHRDPWTPQIPTQAGV
jgi:hypothetical protein